MNERVVRLDLMSGEVQVIPLDVAISELSGNSPFSEIAPRLREGESVRLPNGVCFRAAAAMGEHGMDQLPASAAN